jgi:hypothetical protein
MKRYPCQSHLSVTYGEKKGGNAYINIRLHHHFKHVHYVDVAMPPEAMQMVNEQAEWVMPSDLATKVRLAYPQVSTAQVYNAWKAVSETYWQRDHLQIPSTRKLLVEFSDDVDIFEPKNIPEGAEMLAWGMKKIAERLKGKVVEIGMDATCM